jgi:hypothetical protein
MAHAFSVQKPWMTWTGRVFSFFVAGMMVFSGAMKLIDRPQVMTVFTSRLGFPPETLVPIGIVEVLCALLYAIPKTRVLGAILLCAFLGGATATHVRVAEDFLFPIVFGILVWGGVWLRDARIRSLIPWVEE